MSLRIALLRGINVGGRGRLPVTELRAILESLGASDVATYIQSGNAVFRGDITGNAISDAIEVAKGFRRPCFVIPADTLDQIIADNPFPEVQDPKHLHAVFLGAPAEAASIKAAKGASDRYHLAPEVLYLHTPNGLSKSKLAAGLDRTLGVPHTARNWKTVLTLAGMARK